MGQKLSLESLEIRRFRGLREITIERLGRVNLIVGKNSVGKTSVLEAVRLFAQPGDPNTLSELLESRDEFDPTSRGMHDESGPEIVPVSSLFYGDPPMPDENEPIQIGPAKVPERVLSINLGWYTSIADAIRKDPAPATLSDADDQINNRLLLLVFKMGGYKRVLWVGNAREYMRNRLSTRVGMEGEAGRPRIGVPLRFVGANGIRPADLGMLWDETVLTPLEEDVLNCLNILPLSIERVAFRYLGGRSRHRVPVAKVPGKDAPIPLKRLGDGVNRLFGLALSLANAKGGFLLVDEIENGIHYSVQEGLWRLFFRMAERLNVQVFATTHSYDCIKAFQEAASESEEEGVLIRLAERKGRIIVGEFDERELEIAVEGHIEIR